MIGSVKKAVEEICFDLNCLYLRVLRMRHFVAGEEDFWVLEETRAKHVTKRMVFLVECKDRSRWDFCYWHKIWVRYCFLKE